MKGAQRPENSGSKVGLRSEEERPPDALVGAAQRLVITVPLPPRELSPNARVHWAKKAKAAARYREEVGWMALARARETGWQTPERAKLTIIVGLRGGKGKFYQPRDEDNALSSLKNALDALQDAGVLFSDASDRLEIGRITIARRGPAAVTFFVEAVNG